MRKSSSGHNSQIYSYSQNSIAKVSIIRNNPNSFISFSFPFPTTSLVTPDQIGDHTRSNCCPPLI